MPLLRAAEVFGEALAEELGEAGSVWGGLIEKIATQDYLTFSR
jgi:hypothetical protein